MTDGLQIAWISRRPTGAVRRAFGCGLLGALLFGLSGSPPAAADDLDQADHPADRPREQQEALPATPLGPADLVFLHYAIDHSRLSGQAIELARARAGQPALRRLAETMLDEQRALTDRLLALAGPDSPAAATRIDDHPELRALRAADAASFDPQFLRLMLVSQREAVSRYRTAAEDAALSPAVRQLAGEATPVVERHLERARDTDRMLAEID